MLSAVFSFSLSRSIKLAQDLASVVPQLRPIAVAYDQVQRRYQSFILERFDKFSRGQGNWRKLSDATIRRKGSTGILVDTRAMRLGLAAKNGIGLVSKTATDGRVGMIMGFTNKSSHPRSDLSIAQLATVHHLGLGRVPRRRILVGPGADAKRQMRKGLISACAKVLSGR